MRKLLILITILGSIVLGSLAGSRVDGSVSHILGTAQKTNPAVVTSVPTAVPTPTPATPRLLEIPRLGVRAAVQQVGMDAEGRMDVPTNWTDVGWYNLGFKPGEKGSAVIDGHLDDTSGAPAVFWYIKDLQPGDQIVVTDNNNTTYTFVVAQVISYPFGGAPMQEIFNTTDQPRLNLITCDGSWNRTTHNYSNRTVVYAVLQK